MKNSCFILIGLLTITVWGCNEFQETCHSDGHDMTLSIKNVRSEAESITLTLHAEGEDKDMYIRWGVTYSETDDKTAGKAKAIDGSPSEGKAEVWIDGLDGGQTYHIWGWAYDRNGDRIWTEESTKVKTTEKPKPKPAKLSGTIIGSIYSVDYNNGNAQSTTVNTKNNVFDGNFDTYFASYDRSRTWVGLDLGKQDPQAKARLVELWDAALNEGKLKDLDSYMEDTAKLLDESQELNFKRWRILDQYVHMNYQALGSYEAELGTVRNHIKTRLNTLDELIKKQ